MTAYRQYWAFTALILSLSVYAIYAGVLGWGLAKFPEFTTQGIVAIVFVTFLWAYAGPGHKTAKMIARNERALGIIQRGTPVISGRSEVDRTLTDTISLRKEGTEMSQRDFSLLYDVKREQLEGELTGGIVLIETVRLFMLYFGLLFTLIGIVQGFASQLFPTNPEEAKIYSFTIIKALGLAYLPAAACIGSTLILYVLSSLLHTRVKAFFYHFDNILYRAAVLGQSSVRTSAPERIEHATASKQA